MIDSYGPGGGGGYPFYGGDSGIVCGSLFVAVRVDGACVYVL